MEWLCEGDTRPEGTDEGRECEDLQGAGGVDSRVPVLPPDF